MAAEKEEEKGFVIKDRRVRYDEDSAEDAQSQPQTADIEEATQPSPPSEDPTVSPDIKHSSNPREVTFQSFVYSLASSAVMLLGGEEKEGAEPSPPNLQQASEIIGILSLLQEKTQGNLTSEEDSLLKDMLYTLRITYVERAAAKK